MKVSFNKYERVAGLCILFTIVGIVLTLVSAAVKQGWFESRTHLTTTFENADGVHPGTVVQISGLRAGFVESVELLGANSIRVHFYVLGKFSERVREDSVVQLIRPFIIGERVLDITVGSENQSQVKEYTSLKSEESLDLMTVISGKKLNTSLSRISGMMENVAELASAFLDKTRTQGMVQTFDRIDPLMKNLNNMSLEVIHMGKQINNGDSLKVVLSNVATMTTEINKILPALNRENPNVARDLSIMMRNLAVITKAMGPAMEEVEGDLPMASRRLVETLNETVVTLKAMQKSFFMRSNVQEVKAEEAQRRPANSK